MNFNIFSKTKNAWAKLDNGQLIYVYDIPKQLKKGHVIFAYYREFSNTYQYAQKPYQFQYKIICTLQ